MKKIGLLSLTITIGTFLNAQINFEHSALNDLKLKAKQEQKLIMIDAYTTWCGPCKWMASNTFTNKKVGNFFNSNFVNAKIDMEKGEGLEIAKQYEVNAYPTILFINADGKLMHRSVGATDSINFLKVGNDALNPETQLATFEDKYKNGNKEAAFLLSYINKVDAAGMNPSAAVDDYFKTQTEANYSNQNSWNLIRDFANRKTNSQFIYLLKNKSVFEKKYTIDSINEKIEGVYSTELQRLVFVKKFDAVAYKKMQTEVLALKLPTSEKIVLTNDLSLHSKNQNGALYGKTAVSYVNKYALTNANELNEIAYNVYEMCNDKKVLSEAEKWAKIATSLAKDEPAIMDTYACLLFKNNKKAEAIAYEKSAVDLMKTNPGKFDEQLMADLQKNIDTWSK